MLFVILQGKLKEKKNFTITPVVDYYVQNLKKKYTNNVKSLNKKYDKNYTLQGNLVYHSSFWEKYALEKCKQASRS